MKDAPGLAHSDTCIEVQGDTVPEASTDNHFNIANSSSNPPRVDPVEARRPTVASGWRGWFSLSNMEQKAYSELPQLQNISSGHEDALSESNKQQSLPGSSADMLLPEQTTSSKFKGENAVMVPVHSSSWFNIWPGSASNKSMAETTTTESRPADTSVIRLPTIEASRVESNRPVPGSTWAFWSKDSQRPAQKGDEAEEPGELAITGEVTQNDPASAHAATLGERKYDRGKKTNKGGRQLADDVQEPAPKALKPDLSTSKV